MKPGDEITVNAFGFDKKLKRSWKCLVTGIEGNALTLVGEFKEKVEHPDLGTIEAGTISTEYFWLDGWHNIFRFTSPTGQLKCWYCNLTMPPELSDNSLDYIDLDIDIVIWPDGTHQVLDEAEFAVNAERFDYSSEIRENVRRSVNAIMELLRSGKPPFDNSNHTPQQI